MHARSLALAAGLAALAAAAGCRCGSSRPAVSSAAPDRHWMAGELPPSVDEGTPRDGGTLVVRITAEPPHLSPHFLDPTDLIATRLTLGRVYDTLLRVDAGDAPRYRMVPSAAESYEESDDHLTYTFHLRRGMRFHDGVPVTARDLEATLRLLLDPAQPTATARSYYLDVAEYRALDDDTFRVRLRAPYFLFLRQIATTLPILPKHLIEDRAFRSNPINRAPVGSGPWKFSRWKTLQEVVLERNDAYWGRKPHLERLVFRIVPDATVAMQLFERGELDVMTAIPPDAWVDMPKSPALVEQYHRVRFFPKTYSFVGWNEERPWFGDRRVRTALALLFDRRRFNDSIQNGLERLAVCHFYQDGPDCDPNLGPLPYDPARARALLKEAGWEDHDGDGVLDREGVPFRFTFLAPAGSVFLGKLTAVLAEAYRAAGIDMQVARVEWAVFSQRVHAREFDACAMGWGDVDVESDPFQVWHSSQVDGGSNFVGFREPRADALIERARTEFDEARRSALYRELGRVLYDEQPYMFLFIRPDLDAIRRSVHGLHPSLAYYDFERAWLEAPSAERAAAANP